MLLSPPIAEVGENINPPTLVEMDEEARQSAGPNSGKAGANWLQRGQGNEPPIK